MLQSFIVYGFLGFSMWWFGTIAARQSELIYMQDVNAISDLGNNYSFVIFCFYLWGKMESQTDHQSYLEGYRVLLSN